MEKNSLRTDNFVLLLEGGENFRRDVDEKSNKTLLATNSREKTLLAMRMRSREKYRLFLMSKNHDGIS